MNQSDTNDIHHSLTIPKSIVYILAPVLLYGSVFLSVFAPLPVGLSSLFLGRKLAAIFAFISLIVFSFIVSPQISIANFTIWSNFLISLGIGLGLAEVIRKDMNPMKGIVWTGGVLILLLSTVIFYTTVKEDKSVKELVLATLEEVRPLLDKQKEFFEQSSEEGALEAAALLSQPELMASQFLRTVPGIFFVSLFVSLWANMFLLLKSNRLVNRMRFTNYSESILINFKMPDYMIVPVVVALAIIVYGEYFEVESASIIGISSVSLLGVFYFFQGFGIYLAFLDKFKITGFFRTLLVVTTIMMAGQAIAAVGLLDVFVNFKKLMKKNN